MRSILADARDICRVEDEPVRADHFQDALHADRAVPAAAPGPLELLAVWWGPAEAVADSTALTATAPSATPPSRLLHPRAEDFTLAHPAVDGIVAIAHERHLRRRAGGTRPDGSGSPGPHRRRGRRVPAGPPTWVRDSGWLVGVDRGAVLQAFDERVRRRPEPDGIGGRVETEDHIVRCIGGPGWIGVLWAQLDEARADGVIAAEVERFASASRPWDGKHCSYDRPADLPQRLVAAGFRPEPFEAVLAGEIAELPLVVTPPAGVELRPVTDERSIDALVAVHEEVFREDATALGAMLRVELTRRPSSVAATGRDRRWAPDRRGQGRGPSRHGIREPLGRLHRP